MIPRVKLTTLRVRLSIFVEDWFKASSSREMLMSVSHHGRYSQHSSKKVE